MNLSQVFSMFLLCRSRRVMRVSFSVGTVSVSILVSPSSSMDGKKNPMTTEAAARIQSAEAKQSGGGVQSGGFASRAQSAAAKNESGQQQQGAKK